MRLVKQACALLCLNFTQQPFGAGAPLIMEFRQGPFHLHACGTAAASTTLMEAGNDVKTIMVTMTINGLIFIIVACQDSKKKKKMAFKVGMNPLCVFLFILFQVL